MLLGAMSPTITSLLLLRAPVVSTASQPRCACGTWAPTTSRCTPKLRAPPRPLSARSMTSTEAVCGGSPRGRCS
eukprot:3146135-Alexandrium_andersonii.AAC.1